MTSLQINFFRSICESLRGEAWRTIGWVYVWAGGGGASKKTNQVEVNEVDILMGTHASSGSVGSFSLVLKSSLHYDNLFNTMLNFRKMFVLTILIFSWVCELLKVWTLSVQRFVFIYLFSQG